MNQKDHWEQVYSTKPTEKLGWYEPHLQTSLSWIKGLSLATDARIIDVGGGASTLVDDLLDAGYRSITVLDISETALSLAKARLGEKAGLVTWLHGDIASVSRGVYETPGGTILHGARRAVESLTMDRELLHLRDRMSQKYATLVYNGY